MKAPESFAQAVNPNIPSAKEEAQQQPQEEFDIIRKTEIPVLALDKQYENWKVADLLKPCYTNFQYVDTDDPIQTRRYFEFILTDTGSLTIEHKLKDKNDSDSIEYSKFTISKVISPFQWNVDHLHIPMILSEEHRPQVYNYYNYEQAWYNFLYVRPNTHTWFVKYSEQFARSIIPRWFYDWWKRFGGNELTMPRSFKKHYEAFQIEQGISTLPEHIKLCKYYVNKRISYIISWSFDITEVHRIKHLSKTIKIKGWIPKDKKQKMKQASTSCRTGSTKSKADLKKKLLQALNRLDEADPLKIQELLDTISSSTSDNGDMLDPQGMAQAYLDNDLR
ncbi:uncharacterized protein LOC132631536 isoform X2 [Lycium barbarum]|uniref:uncharacterized protein LOC132631536 isoform X2 n=1 Tax=Lycium barbarum TaxID=112863 RepID=UPI00293E1125|nr:uncharacterized protein LOC132631536 isoform X2 [Lycium barbarum]